MAEKRMFRVLEEFVSPHKLVEDYVLLPQDILVEQPNGTFTKTAQGLGLMGFVIDEETLAACCEQIDEHPPIRLVSFA